MVVSFYLVLLLLYSSWSRRIKETVICNRLVIIIIIFLDKLDWLL
jgi:hypothetical protein